MTEEDMDVKSTTFLEEYVFRIPARPRYPSQICIVASMPKSGTAFLNHILKSYKEFFLFEDIHKDMPKRMSLLTKHELDEFKLTSCLKKSIAPAMWCNVSHLSPSPWNEYLLQKYVSKVVVHIRDPRQAVLSMFHYMRGQVNTVTNKREVSLDNEINLKHLDNWLRTFLPQYVSWLMGWIEIAKNEQIELIFIDYNTLRYNLSNHIESILNFFKVPNPNLFRRYILPQYVPNYTKDFAEIYNTEQLAFCNKLLPDNILEKFNWPKINISNQNLPNDCVTDMNKLRI